MLYYYDDPVVKTTYRAAIQLRRDIGSILDFHDVLTPAPRNPRTSSHFVARVPASGAISDYVLKMVSAHVRKINKDHKDTLTAWRARIVKRGRKPVKGAKYRWGGSLPLAQAKFIDIYIAVACKH